MCKGLEALKEIKRAYVDLPLDDGLSVCTAITKEYKKELKIIEKELKALEIIKKKHLLEGLVNSIQKSKNYDDYKNAYITDITKEEYDLLKEVLL